MVLMDGNASGMFCCISSYSMGPAKMKRTVAIFFRIEECLRYVGHLLWFFSAFKIKMFVNDSCGGT